MLNDAELGAYLKKARPDPALPPRFAELVWHRLERGEALTDAVPGRAYAWWQWFEGWMQPRRALALLALLGVLSGSAGVWSGISQAREEARGRYLAAVAPQL